MTTRTYIYRAAITSVLAWGCVGSTWAEESVLWKTVSTVPAVVVPAFTGQASPFPQTATPQVSATQEVDAAAIEEQQRMRDKAYNYAELLIKNGKAMKPQLSSISVGGMVEGRLGPRVLVNNLWVGVDTKVPVRQVRSSDADDALKILAEFDEAASGELMQTLQAQLAANPTTTLTVQSITSRTLVLKSKDGTTYPVSFNVGFQ